MSYDFKIVKENIESTIIGDDGNWHCNTDNCKCFLKNKNGEIISHQYQCMLYLGYDHFAVCNIISDIAYFMDGYCDDDRYYGILHKEYEINDSKLKWGVIRVNRNEQGVIIPGAETMIIPYLYDRISENNLKTATAYNNRKLTYLDIDINSENYAQQLVPCILEHAVPFSTQYDGFAECSINGITGFIPRNCKAKEYIDSSELIKENEAFLLSKYLNNVEDYVLDDKTIFTYFNLTGIRLQNENNKVLRKKKLPNNNK